MPVAGSAAHADASSLPGCVVGRSASEDLADRSLSNALPIELVARLVSEYDALAACLTAPGASMERLKYAYGRLLGARGALCRLCPAPATTLLPDKTTRIWRRAEWAVRIFLEELCACGDAMAAIAQVEEAWIASAEACMDALAARIHSADMECQLGLLKSIDGVGLHLAQREVFRHARALPASPALDPHQLKLRMRLMALYIMLHAPSFERTLHVIRAYRETFRIVNPAAYPWWFMDMRLTDRQLAWTYRRIGADQIGWRF